MLPSFARQSITRLRPPLIDDGHDNTISDPDWDNAERAPIDGCSVQPGATDELQAGRDATLIQWTVYAPAWVDLLSSDGVEFNGVNYSIDGEPARWPSATGTLDHVVVLLKRWEG